MGAIISRVNRGNQIQDLTCDIKYVLTELDTPHAAGKFASDIEIFAQSICERGLAVAARAVQRSGQRDRPTARKYGCLSVAVFLGPTDKMIREVAGHVTGARRRTLAGKV
jgi:hypothetical protein